MVLTIKVRWKCGTLYWLYGPPDVLVVYGECELWKPFGIASLIWGFLEDRLIYDVFS